MPAKKLSSRRRGADPAAGPGCAAAPCIAGIGASAGGFEAIRSFFRAMPVDSGVAFVVIQHLDPTHASLAAGLFGKFTAMPVCEAAQGMAVEADHVYTAPSDQDLAIRDGRFQFSPRGDRRQLHLPVDHFFAALGEDCGARAIGIIFSGSGSDGAAGVRAIAAAGGIVLVQEPGTAQFDGMPRSAIAAGAANHVLPVERMPAVIAGYARHPYAAGVVDAAADEGDAAVTQDLLRLVQAHCDYDFSGYKRSTLLRRIHRRMGLLGIVRLAAYVSLLKKDGGEVDALFRDLLIGVTEFFRDPEAWKLLASEVIGPLVAARQRDEPIRIWVPGCSTGEEAYSMAMVVLDALRLARKHCALQIFATDSNHEALEIARAGRYPAGIVDRIPAARLRRYFVEAPDPQHYLVSAELRNSVVFGMQNLFADPPFVRVDVISCRNVLIYLEPEVQKRVLGVCHFALRPDGCLFLGNAESNGGRDDLFRPISKKWRIYRREGSARVNPPPLPPRLGDLRSSVAVAAPARGQANFGLAMNIAQKLILDRFAPASVLVNTAHETLYFCGPTDEFLMRPRGAPTQDLLAMLREGLRSRVRAALGEAVASDLPVSVGDARMKAGKGFSAVQVTVTPTAGGDLGRLYLLVFRHAPPPPLVPAESSAEAVLVRQLEEELQATRDDLQDTIERFETANEDLKVSNEEVVSINEELRSLNEELESSKEELQSLNEELTTVNQQLEAKLRELEVANSDLKNLLNSSDIATLCLDCGLRIKWFTPATQKQFNFIASDIGRSIGDFSPALGGAGLVDAATAVLARHTVTQQEFQAANARWYVRRVLPYKDENGRVSGVIVTYTDITDGHLAADIDGGRGEAQTRQLREHTDKLRKLSAALALAEERERRVLAQDLHDDLGQILAVVKLKVSAIDKRELSPAMRTALDECSGAVDQANRKLRTMAFQLSPPMLYERGLLPALEWMADEMRHVYRLDVRTDDDDRPKPLDPAVSATLFRAVRELLINVAKHARVDTATVSTARGDDNTVLITVTDAGTGFDPDAVPVSNGMGGFGLLSVRERIGYLGGEVTIRSNPGDGTSVILKAPLLHDAR